MASNTNITFTPYQTIIPSTWLNNVNQVVNNVVPVSLLFYGCACDGVTDDTSKVLSAISLIGTTTTTLIVPSQTKISSNITFGANTTVLFWEGGGFKGAAGTEVITFNQPIRADRFQIFSNCLPIAGVGMVAFPEWFGAVRNGTTNDTAAINAANAFLLNTGGIISLNSGTYAMGGVVLNSNIALLGQGKSTNLTAYSGFSSTGNFISIATNAINVEIGNFSVNLSITTYNNANTIWGNTGSSYAYIHDIYMTAAGAFGVDTTGVSHYRVERVTILSAQTIGIAFQNGTWNLVKECYVTGVVGSHHIALSNEQNSEIAYCQSYRVTGSGFGMNINVSNHCRITNCITQDSIVEGINITDSSNCTVTNNTCSWSNSSISQDFGMSINASSTNCNLNIFANNNVSNCGKSGIAIAGSSSNASGNIITGNNIYASGQLGLANDGGILIYQTTGQAINNIIEGNMIFGDGTHTKYGVLESSAYGGTPNNQRIGLNSVFAITVANVSTVGANTVSFIPTNW